MITGTCVCANESFTLFDEYDITFGDGYYSENLVVTSDDLWIYVVYDQGDGYYGCVDANGKEVCFLVE